MDSPAVRGDSRVQDTRSERGEPRAEDQAEIATLIVPAWRRVEYLPDLSAGGNNERTAEPTKS